MADEGCCKEVMLNVDLHLLGTSEMLYLHVNLFLSGITHTQSIDSIDI